MNQGGERSKKKWSTKLEGLLKNFTTCLNNHDRVYSGHFAQIMEFCPVHSSKKVLSRYWACSCQIVSQFSHSVMSNSLQPHGSQHTSIPCPSPTPRVCSNSCPLTVISLNHLIFCRPLLLPSIFPSIRVFSKVNSSHQLAKVLELQLQHHSFLKHHHSFLPMDIQDLFPLELTSLISLLSKGHSSFFNTTVQKHQFFSPQLSLWSNSHIHTWPLEKP